MPNYTVTISETIEEHRSYEIEADSPEAAHQIAHDKWIGNGEEPDSMQSDVMDRFYSVDSGDEITEFESDPENY